MRARLAAIYDEATTDAVIQRLRERRILDDVRLARDLLEANYGRKAMAVAELRRRCAERGADTDALALFDGAAEPALDALIDRFDRSESGRARAYRYLASKGFDESVIESALARLE